MDIALAYDPATHRCDMVFNGRDFALDATPATAMLLSLGSDRRARPDDALPDDNADPANPASLIARRGYPGDALDTPLGAQSRLIGSRLWLLLNAKANEATRKFCEQATAEAVDWLNTQRGLAVQVLVRWVRPGVLGIRVRAGASSLQLEQAVAS